MPNHDHFDVQASICLEIPDCFMQWCLCSNHHFPPPSIWDRTGGGRGGGGGKGRPAATNCFCGGPKAKPALSQSFRAWRRRRWRRRAGGRPGHRLPREEARGQGAPAGSGAGPVGQPGQSATQPDQHGVHCQHHRPALGDRKKRPGDDRGGHQRRR